MEGIIIQLCEYLLSCGREGEGSHLPLPPTDLLPWQILEGAGDEGTQVLHLYQDPRSFS